jgi:S-DNA-T family DNA segregation ATPase FtsK/SpoIIIE
MTSVDGTWVIPRPGWVCPECGFDYDASAPPTAPATLRAVPGRYRIPLERGLPGEDLDALLRARPGPGRWSALEYVCHTRDAMTLYDDRIDVALTEDRPEFAPMGRDQRAVDDAYNTQDPHVVLEQLAAAADGLAARVESVPPDGWARVGYRVELEMSVDWMTRNAVHEASHHLLDVGRTLRGARRAARATT